MIFRFCWIKCQPFRNLYVDNLFQSKYINISMKSYCRRIDSSGTLRYHVDNKGKCWRSSTFPVSVIFLDFVGVLWWCCLSKIKWVDDSTVVQSGNCRFAKHVKFKWRIKIAPPPIPPFTYNNLNFRSRNVVLNCIVRKQLCDWIYLFATTNQTDWILLLYCCIIMSYPTFWWKWQFGFAVHLETLPPTNRPTHRSSWLRPRIQLITWKLLWS